jgi:hypothetical protein
MKEMPNIEKERIMETSLRHLTVQKSNISVIFSTSTIRLMEEEVLRNTNILCL